MFDGERRTWGKTFFRGEACRPLSVRPQLESWLVQVRLPYTEQIKMLLT